jgi:hypothetical protein
LLMVVKVFARMEPELIRVPTQIAATDSCSKALNFHSTETTNFLPMKLYTYFVLRVNTKKVNGQILVR